jgi:DNA-binding response OmpR family regulator
LAQIVICEDDPVAMKALMLSLQGDEHQIFTATDGVRGLELVERERPTLLVTDVVMPRLSGLALVDEIRSRPELSHVQIILVSAAAQREALAEGHARAVDDYVTKPFQVADLRRRVQQVLSRRAGPARS